MIRFAKKRDIPSIMTFIDAYWKKGHILSKDIDLFCYQYVIDNKVNMVLSFDNENNLNGFLGFIPYNDDYKQVSLAMWKALQSCDGFIGLKLLDYLIDEIKPEIVATPGVNPDTTKSLYKFLGYEFNKMNHFYRLYKKDKYCLAGINEYIKVEYKNVEQFELKRISNIEQFKELNIVYDNNSFNKSVEYIKHRYFDGYYDYELYSVEDGNNILIIVLRKQEMNGSLCLRIIDMLGKYSLLNNIIEELDLLATNCNAEYIDCYCTGVDRKIFINSGFIDNDINIIPDYFYPFEQRNVDIFYSSNVKNRVLFKGDGDMDRPN